MADVHTEEAAMVSSEIRSNSAALGVLMHQVSQDQAELLRIVRANLIAAADDAEELERHLLAPLPVGPAATKEIAAIEEFGLKEAM